MTTSSPVLTSLSGEERNLLLLTMERYGSGAFRLLAAAMRRFDPNNFQRQLRAFPELLETYGPGTGFYEQTRCEYQQECLRDRAFLNQLFGS